MILRSVMRQVRVPDGSMVVLGFLMVTHGTLEQDSP